MLKLIKSAPLFFSSFTLFLIIGAVLLCSIDQGDAIIFFGDNRTPFGNFFFEYFTKLGEEYIYIILISIFVFIRFRYAILILLNGIITLLIAYGLKVYFSHPRPFVFFTQLDQLAETNPIEGIKLYSGMTSFPSGHTMSAFAVYTLTTLLFHQKKWLGLGLFFMALFVGISRIYLVQHFLKDVYLGAIAGTLIAMIVYSIQKRYSINEKNWIDRSFSSSKSSEKA